MKESEITEESAHVLLVDDDDVTLVYLSNLLVKLGYIVHQANNADDAFRLIRKFDFPLIVVLDLLMEGNDGYVLCQLVRNTEVTHQPYIIAHTVLSDQESMLRAFDAGADDFMVKGAPQAIIRRRLLAGCRVIAAQSGLEQRGRELAERTSELENVLELSEVRLFEENFVSGRANFLVEPIEPEYLIPIRLDDLKQQIRSADWQHVDEILKEPNQAVEFEILVQIDGKPKRRWLEQKTIRRVIQDGEEINRVSIARDITESKTREKNLKDQLKLVEETNARISRIVEDGQIGIFEYDTATEALNFNYVLARFFWLESFNDKNSASYEEFSTQLTDESKSVFLKAIFSAAEAFKALKIDLEIESMRGKQRWLRVSTTPTYESEVCINLSGTVVDLSDHYELLQAQSQKSKKIG